MALDRIDAALVAALQNDARLSNKELAARVGLSPSACLERVRKLGREGVLTGFHAEVDPRALGIGLQALIAIQLDKHSRENLVSLREHLLTLPEVQALYYVSGTHDFLAHVVVRDAEHLRDLCLDGISSRHEVGHMETSVIFEADRRPVLPSYLDL